MSIWFSMAKYIRDKQNEQNKASWKCRKCGDKATPERLRKQGAAYLRCRSCGHTIDER